MAHSAPTRLGTLTERRTLTDRADLAGALWMIGRCSAACNRTVQLETLFRRGASLCYSDASATVHPNRESCHPGCGCDYQD
jgi:hypothetical protein